MTTPQSFDVSSLLVIDGKAVWSHEQLSVEDAGKISISDLVQRLKEAHGATSIVLSVAAGFKNRAS